MIVEIGRVLVLVMETVGRRSMGGMGIGVRTCFRGLVWMMGRWCCGARRRYIGCSER